MIVELVSFSGTKTKVVISGSNFCRDLEGRTRVAIVTSCHISSPKGLQKQVTDNEVSAKAEWLARDTDRLSLSKRCTRQSVSRCCADPFSPSTSFECNSIFFIVHGIVIVVALPDGLSKSSLSLASGKPGQRANFPSSAFFLCSHQSRRRRRKSACDVRLLKRVVQSQV